MHRIPFRLITVPLLLAAAACGDQEKIADVLLSGGSVLDGSGADPVAADVAVTGTRISFVGDAGH